MTDFAVRRGVNVGGWLSQSSMSDQERESRFGPDDIARIAEYGFDHIRLPIDEAYFWDDSGMKREIAWRLMDRFLDWCDDAGLRAIVDMHILRDHYFNADEKPLFSDPAAPPRFAQLWKELSVRLAARSVDKVAYELLNEPVADDHADWNRVYRFPYRLIREREPDRMIVLGSNRWNQAATFDSLDIPPDDRNLILTFHYYNSMLVTHYRAQFVPECALYDGPIQYPGRAIPSEAFAALEPHTRALLAKWNDPHGMEAMERELAKPVAARQRTGLPLYCGEFGVISKAPDSIRRAWARDFVTVLTDNDICWAPWNYSVKRPGGFSLFEQDASPSAFCKGLLEGLSRRA
jgi:endoglucanase